MQHKQKSYRLLWLITTIVIGTNTSCKKFVTPGPPKTQIEAINVFSNDNAALSAALGVYADMGISNLYIMSGGMTLYPALSADELVYTSSNTELLSFQHNSLVAGNGTGIYTRLWVPAYRYIYEANSVIEGVTASVMLTPAVSNQLKGEMLVIRALNYFCLVNLFGDVPLELTTDYKANSITPRTPVAEIYNQLAKDLAEAKQLLAEDYPSTLRARPNKYTAAALLAQIYLYQKKWADAEAEASGVINSGEYILEPELDKVFSQSSGETIWQLANDYHNTGEGATFVPFSGTSRPSYALTGFLLSAFDPGDRRLDSWTGSNVVGSKTYYFPNKYKVRSSDNITESYVVLRLAEQYLIRAEARAQLGNIDGAVTDINMLRSRAGLDDFTGTGKDPVLAEVYHERQVELFCEWGKRWCDLKRTGLANTVLGERKMPDWNPDDMLYPVPAIELINNPFLVQNKGY